MHIDHSWFWQQDSRLTHTEKYLNRAIAIFPDDPERALLYLGRGSHPLQDKHAHGQIGSGLMPGWAWGIPGGLIFGPKGAVAGWVGGQLGHAHHSILPSWIGLGDPDGLSYDWADDGKRRLRRIPYEWRDNEAGKKYLVGADLRFNERFIAAVLDTEAYLRYFMEATGFSVKDSLY